ncbi:hypothetical protein ACL02S_15065 [Nocardia sp. 004]|uniref:hypothetical protein n=1 Tax=Nocardia sp. 004 TaxID=3385978 RepID=UPI00399F8ACD
MSITVAILALGGSLIFEALANAQSDSGSAYTYLTAAIKTVFLFIMFSALTGYYAAADGTDRGRRVAFTVTVIGGISAAAVLGSGVTVTPGRQLWDFQHTDTLTYYVSTAIFFPVACLGAGLLATRLARRALGSLRFALGLGAAALWLLAAVSAFTPYSYWVGYRSGTSSPDGPHANIDGPLGVFLFVGFIGGCLMLVISFGAVAIAHRTRQLRATWIALFDLRAMRHLRDDLSRVAPELSFPRSGWKPIMLRPHTARTTARIECRDRLVRLSPKIAAELDPDDHQNPDAVAAVLYRLYREGSLHQPHESVPAVPILTDPRTNGRDQLIPLARSYARLRTTE